VRGDGDFYYHPFTVPLGYGRIDLAPYVNDIENYAIESNFQHHICEAGLAPRGMSEGEFQGQCNYAYHLDAGAFAELLKQHCRSELGVEHVIATVLDANLDDADNITSLLLEKEGKQESFEADLFVDCTGFRSLLLGGKLDVPFISTDDILFNDTALAMHVPYENDDDPVACHTIATGQNAGWTWDIGLTARRGVGHVYSSQYLSDDEAAENLRQYLGNNCVAIGMSAGFVEPLEATAIMLVEVGARYIAENLPPDNEVMKITEKRFNQQMDYRWQRIIDFLKLHYILTETLKEDLKVWKYRGPISSDFDGVAELFPAASYQYVMYGMGFKPDFSKQQHLYNQQQNAERIKQQNLQLTEQMLQTLPPHRQYIRQWLAK